MMWLVNRVGFGMDTDRTDISYRIFNDYFDLPIHAEAEIIVDYKDTVAAIETLRDVILENEFPVNYITEVNIVNSTVHMEIWCVLATLIYRMTTETKLLATMLFKGFVRATL